MKRKLLVVSSLVALSIAAVLIVKSNADDNNAIENLREQHISHLENSPYKETQKLSRTERKAMGLPPNAYNEQMWELMMDPAIGRPTPEVAIEIAEQVPSSVHCATSFPPTDPRRVLVKNEGGM